MHTLKFLDPDPASKWDLLSTHLAEMKLLCSHTIGWLCFTKSVQKGIWQGCQSFLRRQLIKGTVQRKHAASLPPLEEERRYVYFLPGHGPGKEGGHRLMINRVRTALILLQRLAHSPLGRITYHAAEYEARHIADGSFDVATRQTMPDGTLVLPDLLAQMESPQGTSSRWFFEMDTGTESIVAGKIEHAVDEPIWDETAQPSFRKHCLLEKVYRYQSLCAGTEDRLLFIFHSQRRLESVQKTLLAHVGHSLPWVYMATRQAIESPSAFWTASVWHALTPDRRVFSLWEAARPIPPTSDTTIHLTFDTDHTS